MPPFIPQKGPSVLRVGTSIRMQFYVFLTLTAVLCVSVVLLSLASTQEVIQSTNTFFDCNRSLSDFYTAINEMDISARNWVYSGSDADYESYLQAAKTARRELGQIRSNGDRQLIWRIGLLENMMVYYEKPIHAYLAGQQNTYQTYSELLYRCSLICDTATDYHNYLADFMQEHAGATQARWRQKCVMQIAALLVLILVGMTISNFYSKSILRPIQVLTENARRVQRGDFHLEPIGQASAELAVMADAFAEMASHVEENIDVVKKNSQLEQMVLRQESERLTMQNLVTQAELRTLQAQINPHFLFNTLSMISKSAYLSHDNTTSELIDRLAEFLRYALDKSNTTSTLQEEINSIQNYLFIQKKRFSGRLDFVVDIADDIPPLQMPAIVLQPLVENAIKHGVGPLMEEAIISLKVRFREGRIRIQIEDNGVGMSAEQVEELQSRLKLGLGSSNGGDRAGIGLTNVYHRLKMYFGAELQFTIESEENCGTLITISLPVEESV